jgi:hypothetical protein
MTGILDVKFTLRNAPELLKALATAEQFGKGSELSKTLDTVAQKLLEFHISRFKAEQTPDGGNWLRSLASIRESRPTLQDTGQLLRSIKIFAETPTQRQVGIDPSDTRNFEIGLKHNTLGDGKRKIIRRFIGFNNSELDQIEAILSDRLNKVF